MEWLVFLFNRCSIVLIPTVHSPYETNNVSKRSMNVRSPLFRFSSSSIRPATLPPPALGSADCTRVDVMGRRQKADHITHPPILAHT
jgi:hypothetical protein